MLKSATMNSRILVAKQAAEDIEKWLKHFSFSLEVINVEDDPGYQAKDIDLVWKTTTRGDITVEIKGDTYHQTGNIFLETYSNKERNTPGCFMYTEADFVCYYFVKIRKLYVLPMPQTRTWFLEHIDEFKEQATQTEVGNGNQYTTVGRLIPIAILLQGAPGVKVHQL